MKIRLTALTLLLLLHVHAALAAEGAEAWTRLRGAPGYRLDVDVLHDRLDPADLYGDWTTATATLYVRTLPRLTPFVQAGLFEREDVDAGLTLGAYADWRPGLYSYTAFTTGGASRYLPRHRWDHAFYLDAGPAWLVLGGGWLEDYAAHEDWYLSCGPRIWRGAWIAEYRITRTESDPGAAVSWKHLVSLGWGTEGRSWLFLYLTAGTERYTATWVVPYQGVAHDFRELSASWQKWLRPRLGVKLQAGWLDLGTGLDGYRKLSAGVGAFVEF
jgi:YaiO family outer membrane protein